MATLELKYTGRTATITAIHKCDLHYSIVGGGGGAGGRDSYLGSDGCAGLRVNGVISLEQGEQLECTVASGGLKGTRGERAVGAIGGRALNGYSGGTGSDVGNSGSSGSGGGGGGATVLKRPDSVGGEIIAIAAGGGGGGGGGDYGAGYIKPDTINNQYGEVWWRSFYDNGPAAAPYCQFLKSYGVWTGNLNSIHLTYEVYFPSSGTYTFRISADNYGYLWLDNGEVNGNADFIGNTPGNNTKTDFDQYYDFDHYVSEGWHTVDVYATNSGDKRSVAAAAFKKNTSRYIWTTRDSYNDRSAVKGRGGAGQWASGDHGGTGGGGGGYIGGMGALNTASGDVGNSNGSTGYSYIRSQDEEDSYYFHGDLGDAGYPGLKDSGSGQGKDGIAVFSAYQHDLRVRRTTTRKQYGWFGKTIVETTWEPAKSIHIYENSQPVSVGEVYVKDSGVWKRIFGDDTPTYVTGAIVASATSGAAHPANPPPIIDRSTGIIEDVIDLADDLVDGIVDGIGGVVEDVVSIVTGGKIICTKLYELGLMDRAIYEADQAFGAQLLEQNPDVYNGYRAWAEIVVDWMNGEGPNMLPWLPKERSMQITRDWSIKWAKDIATPWAEEMAYAMGKKDSGSLTGRMITAVGTPICKVVGVWQRLIGPSKKPAGFIKGLSLIAIFALFKLVVEVCRLVEGKK